MQKVDRLKQKEENESIEKQKVEIKTDKKTSKISGKMILIGIGILATGIALVLLSKKLIKPKNLGAVKKVTEQTIKKNVIKAMK